MSSIRKYSLTKEDLVRNGYFVEGEKVFKQSSNGVREIKQQIIVSKHKYGLEKLYIYLTLLLFISKIGINHIIIFFLRFC